MGSVGHLSDSLMADIRLPRANQGLINLKDGPQGNAGTATRPFYDWMRQLSSSGAEGLQEQIDAILAIIGSFQNFQIKGNYSVRVSGTPQGGVVSLSLLGDNSAPGASKYYGTDPVGAKGFWPLPVSDSTVPYFVPAGENYTVNANKQALWKLPITLGLGASLTISGALEQVT